MVFSEKRKVAEMVSPLGLHFEDLEKNDTHNHESVDEREGALKKIVEGNQSSKDEHNIRKHEKEIVEQEITSRGLRKEVGFIEFSDLQDQVKHQDLG